MKRVVLGFVLVVFLLWSASPAAAGGAHFSDGGAPIIPTEVIESETAAMTAAPTTTAASAASFVAEPIAQGGQPGTTNVGLMLLGAGFAFVAVALTAFVSAWARQSSAK